MLAAAALVLLCLLAVAIGVVRSAWFGRQSARGLEAAVEAVTGEDAVLGGLRVDPFKLAVQIDGLVLTHRSEDPERRGQTIAAVERVTAFLRVEHGRPALRRLEVVRPTVRLHLDADGLREFRGMESSSTPSDDLPWDELWVREGELVLEMPRGQVVLEGIDVEPRGEPGLVDVALGRVGVTAGPIGESASAVALEEVRFSTGSIEVPELHLAFPHVSIDGSVSLESGGPVHADLGAEVLLSGLDALIPADHSLEGLAALDVLVAGDLDAPQVSGRLGLSGARYGSPTDGGGVHYYAPGPVELGWRLEGRQLVVDNFTTEWGGGTVELLGTVDVYTLGVSGHVAGKDLSLVDALRATGASEHAWVGLQADLSADIAGTLSPLAIAGSFDLPFRKLQVAGSPVESSPELVLDMPTGRLKGEIWLDPEQVRVQAHSFRAASSTGWIDARIGLDALGPLDARFVLNDANLADFGPLGGLEWGGRGVLSGVVRGPFDHLRIDGRARIRDLELYGVPLADELDTPIVTTDLVHLRMPGFKARVGDTRYSGFLELAFLETLTMDLQLVLHEGRIADLTGMFFELPEIDGEVEGTLDLQGDPLALGGDVDLSLTDVEMFGEHFEQGRLGARMDHGLFTLDALSLSRRHGSEAIYARGSVGSGWKTNMEVIGSGFRLERSDGLAGGSGQLLGIVSVDARVGGTLFEPEPRGRIDVRDAWVSGERVDRSTLNFKTRGGVLSFEGSAAGTAASFSGNLDLWKNQAYDVAGTLDAFPLHLFYPVAVDGQRVEARTTGSFQLSGAFGDESVPSYVYAVLDDVFVAWDGRRLESLNPWVLKAEGGGYNADGVRIKGENTDMTFGAVVGDDGNVLVAGGGDLDLNWMRMLVPGLERTEGVGQVQVRITGTGQDLRPSLTLAMEGALLRTEWFPHAFEDVTATVSATPRSYALGEVTARVGGGTLALGGVIDAEDWVPSRYALRGELSDARIQYLDWLPPVTGKASLSFDGPASDPLLSGRVDAARMTFSDRIDWEQWVIDLSGASLDGAAAEEDADLFSMDIELVADKTIHVQNNVGNLDASAELRVVGDTSRPGLVGTIRAVPGGRVHFKERDFELQRGELHFVDPYTYDPDVDLAMTTQIRARERTYDIDYHVGGTMAEWTPTVGSDPPLADADINALLVFGMTREELERYGGITQAMGGEVADIFQSGYVQVERLGDGVFKAVSPSRVDLVSGVSERGSNSVTSEVRLFVEKEFETDTVVSFEQNLSRTSDRYLSVEQRLARKLYGRGYWASEQIGRSLPIGGAYGAEFNLRWEFD